MTVNLSKAGSGSFVTPTGARVTPQDNKPAVTKAAQLLPPPPDEIRLPQDRFEAAQPHGVEAAGSLSGSERHLVALPPAAATQLEALAREVQSTTAGMARTAFDAVTGGAPFSSTSPTDAEIARLKATIAGMAKTAINAVR